MPDLDAFGFTRTGTANVNVPTHEIHGKLIEGAVVLADYTGENALLWPGVLGTLAVEQQDALVDLLAPHLIRMKAGLE